MQATVAGTSSLVLWPALERVDTNLSFVALGDEAFQQLVLARIVEPSSRATLCGCWRKSASLPHEGDLHAQAVPLGRETPKEDRLRKVGMSKEWRVDPEVTVGLLCDPGGLPLAVHLFEADGQRVETTRAMGTGKDRRTRRVVPVLLPAGHEG